MISPITLVPKMSDRQFNLTVLISGNGSNLQALIDACASGALPNTRITNVISKYVSPQYTSLEGQRLNAKKNLVAKLPTASNALPKP